ncbi:MAG: hypothetical protein R2686_06890 [Candidatus Nanopelagicales bacterium]
MTTDGQLEGAPHGSAQGLLDFLTWTGDKHEIVESTASALRTGCQKVLSVEDDLLLLDLRSADIDNIVERFRVSSRVKMKPRTVDQYEQRFRQSVDMYQRYLNGDPDWKPSSRARNNPSSGKPGAKRAVTVKQSQAEARTTAPRPRNGDRDLGISDLIAYPFPLRPGLTAQVHLPADVTSREAKRLAAFIAALSVDDAQDSPSGDALS